MPHVRQRPPRPAPRSARAVINSQDEGRTLPCAVRKKGQAPQGRFHLANRQPGRKFALRRINGKQFRHERIDCVAVGRFSSSPSMNSGWSRNIDTGMLISRALINRPASASAASLKRVRLARARVAQHPVCRGLASSRLQARRSFYEQVESCRDFAVEKSVTGIKGRKRLDAARRSGE